MSGGSNNKTSVPTTSHQVSQQLNPDDFLDDEETSLLSRNAQFVDDHEEEIHQVKLNFDDVCLLLHQYDGSLCEKKREIYFEK